ncbi:peptidoglycan DD-metalloendopeptidase family protein [Streptomyces sp. PSKA28]|uniref:Peptidoglycan DD-metalloendopeptidase family protein n=2 Tax=Streptomyces TaxID=1883 RepID=A0A7W0I746_9ACTN|nr:peptidoglycan DD-metalloendopeptidase family protein [Streptomyces himalayensis]MBA2944808.1 peptidoglycan DD-metalloendopeptidase family protein [Streptomyces himalayensis subsp. himalayensis]
MAAAAAVVGLLGAAAAPGVGSGTGFAEAATANRATAVGGTVEAARAVRRVQSTQGIRGVPGVRGRAGPPEPMPAVAEVWPVGVRPVVVRGWEPPATEYGPGHRGVDLAAAAGAPVRAVAPGRVSFAGRVAGRGVIAVELDGTGDPPLRTTYEPVRAEVEKGDEVVTGQIIGTVEAGGSHCPDTGCLHWGLRRGDTYLNPLLLLPPWLLNRGPSRLLPVAGVPLPAGPQ